MTTFILVAAATLLAIILSLTLALVVYQHMVHVYSIQETQTRFSPKPNPFSEIILDEEIRPRTYFGTYQDRRRTFDFYVPLYSSGTKHLYYMDGTPVNDIDIEKKFWNHLRHQDFIKRMEEAQRRDLPKNFNPTLIRGD